MRERKREWERDGEIERKTKEKHIFLENNKSGKNKANFCPSQFPSVFSVLKANLRKKNIAEVLVKIAAKNMREDWITSKSFNVHTKVKSKKK